MAKRKQSTRNRSGLVYHKPPEIASNDALDKYRKAYPEYYFILDKLINDWVIACICVFTENRDWVKTYLEHQGSEEYPADLLLSGKVAILDYGLSPDDKIEMITQRVCIFDDYHERLINATGDRDVVVGVVGTPITETGSIYGELLVNIKRKMMYIGYIGWQNVKPHERLYIEKNTSQTELRERLANALDYWLGIQQILMHPEAKAMLDDLPADHRYYISEKTHTITNKKTKYTRDLLVVTPAKLFVALSVVPKIKEMVEIRREYNAEKN